MSGGGQGSGFLVGWRLDVLAEVRHEIVEVLHQHLAILGDEVLDGLAVGALQVLGGFLVGGADPGIEPRAGIHHRRADLSLGDIGQLLVGDAQVLVRTVKEFVIGIMRQDGAPRRRFTTPRIPVFSMLSSANLSQFADFAWRRRNSPCHGLAASSVRTLSFAGSKCLSRSVMTAATCGFENNSMPATWPSTWKLCCIVTAPSNLSAVLAGSLQDSVRSFTNRSAMTWFAVSRSAAVTVDSELIAG